MKYQTSNCSLLLIYRPRRDEKLSWPGWLTCSGWLTHSSGHPSAAGRAQDSESSPAKNNVLTTEPHHQVPKRINGKIKKNQKTKTNLFTRYNPANLREKSVVGKICETATATDSKTSPRNFKGLSTLPRVHGEQ